VEKPLPSAQVYSQNVVGYNTIQIAADEASMIAFNYEEVGKTSGIALKDLVPDQPFLDGDQIQVAYIDPEDPLKALKFAAYTYYTQDYLDNNIGFGDEGWNDGSIQNQDDLVFQPGSGVWILLNGERTITVAGQVKPNGNAYSFGAGEAKMIGAGFPIPFNPNTCVWNGIQDGDQIQVVYIDPEDPLKALKFTAYTYYTQDYLDNNIGFGDEGWNDGSMALAGQILGIGKSCWVLTQGTTTMTMASPL
jgi:hypothetical protein